MRSLPRAYHVSLDQPLTIEEAMELRRSRFDNDPRCGLLLCCKSCYQRGDAVHILTRDNSTNDKSDCFARWPTDSNKSFSCPSHSIARSRRESIYYGEFYSQFSTYLESLPKDCEPYFIESWDDKGEIDAPDFELKHTPNATFPWSRTDIVIIDENKRRMRGFRKTALKDDAALLIIIISEYVAEQLLDFHGVGVRHFEDQWNILHQQAEKRQAAEAKRRTEAKAAAEAKAAVEAKAAAEAKRRAEIKADEEKAAAGKAALTIREEGWKLLSNLKEARKISSPDLLKKYLTHAEELISTGYDTSLHRTWLGDSDFIDDLREAMGVARQRLKGLEYRLTLEKQLKELKEPASEREVKKSTPPKRGGQRPRKPKQTPKNPYSPPPHRKPKKPRSKAEDISNPPTIKPSSKPMSPQSKKPKRTAKKKETKEERNERKRMHEFRKEMKKKTESRRERDKEISQRKKENRRKKFHVSPARRPQKKKDDEDD